MWAVMSVFLTMAGSHWVSEYGYDSDSSGNGEIMNSLIFFTLPILVTLSIASYCRVLIARRFGIEIGTLPQSYFQFLHGGHSELLGRLGRGSSIWFQFHPEGRWDLSSWQFHLSSLRLEVFSQ